MAKKQKMRWADEGEPTGELDVFRKRLMQEWADFIDKLTEYYETNVIPINATAAG